MRIVLREDVSRDQIDDAAVEHGWRFVNAVPASAERPAELVFLTSCRHNLMQLFDDPRLGARYFLVRGADRRRAQKEIVASLPTYHEMEIRDLVEHPASEDDYLRGVYYTALTSGTTPRAHVLETIDRALRHPSADVRMGALAATSCLDWDEVIPMLERVARDDDDGEIRERASEQLAEWLDAGDDERVEPAAQPDGAEAG